MEDIWLMRATLILFAFTLLGCPSPGLFTGSLGIASQQGYSLNTNQKCIKARETVKIADKVMPVIISELMKAGYIRKTPTDYNKVMICTIERPEPCSMGGWTRGPWKEINGEKVGARKRGCTISGALWVSLYWPPVCTAEWPAEPAGGSVKEARKYCVGSKRETFTRGWRQILIHELFNLAVSRWANTRLPSGDYYKAKIYEVEALVNKRLKR